MAENGQTAVAWEMLSSVVVLRAKARENKLPKLLSSLHGVEVELARIIADSDKANTKAGEANGTARLSRTPAVTAVGARNIDSFGEIDGLDIEPGIAVKTRSAKRGGGGSRGDQHLRAQAKKYLTISRQLGELVSHGEAIATGSGFEDVSAFDDEAASDALLAEQQELTYTISTLRASTFEGLVDKATVLDDLIEENTDDPVQVLARSLARDVVSMGQSRKTG